MKKLFLMLWDAVRGQGWFLSYYYKKEWYVNKNTGEVHVLGAKCIALKYHNPKSLIKMSEYDLYVFKKSHPFVNGCAKCNNVNDTDKIYNGSTSSDEVTFQEKDDIVWVRPFRITQELLLWG